MLDCIENDQQRYNLNDCYEKMKQCNQQLYSAANFIDFSTHDILDYIQITANSNSKVARDGSNKLSKNIETFDLMIALNEIILIKDEKAKLKNIKVDTQFLGKENVGWLITTDKRRLQ